MSTEQRGAGLAEPPSRDEVRAGGAGRGAGAPKVKAQHHHHGPPRGVIREYFESLVVTAVMALFGMTFIVQAVKVPTGSMQNTILIGDHLLVNKFIFAPGPSVPFLPQREIRRGDIIVFKYPGKFPSEQFQRHTEVDDAAANNTPFKTNYVKRVVGLPGERVEIRGTDVYINGELWREQKVAGINPPHDDDDDEMNGDERGAPLRDETGLALVGDNAPAREAGMPYVVYWNPRALSAPQHEEADEAELRSSGFRLPEKSFEIPEGHYLVLGDNRENSQDSRFWGFVPRDLVIGRAMFVYWSYDESKPKTGGRLGFLSDFIGNTRWSRTGTLVK